MVGKGRAAVKCCVAILYRIPILVAITESGARGGRAGLDKQELGRHPIEPIYNMYVVHRVASCPYW